MSIYPRMSSASGFDAEQFSSLLDIYFAYDVKDGVPLTLIGTAPLSGSSIFQGADGSLSPCFTRETLSFFLRNRNDPRTSFMFLLTKRGDPVCIVTSFLRYGGLTVVLVPKFRPNIILSVLSMATHLPHVISPEFEAYAQKSSNDRLARKQFELMMQHLVQFFDFTAPSPCDHDTFQLFRWMQRKGEALALSLGITFDARMQYPCPKLQRNTPIDVPLYVLTLLALFANLKQSVKKSGGSLSAEFVLFVSNGFPYVCLHHPCGELNESDRLGDLLQQLYQEQGAFFRSSYGIYLPKELSEHPIAQRIEVSALTLTEKRHAFTVFVPSRNSRAMTHVKESPFRLPPMFFECADETEVYTFLDDLLQAILGHPL